MMKKPALFILIGIFFSLLFVFCFFRPQPAKAAKCSGSQDEIPLSISNQNPDRNDTITASYTSTKEDSYDLSVIDTKAAWSDRTIWTKDLDSLRKGTQGSIPINLASIDKIKVGGEYNVQIMDNNGNAGSCGVVPFTVKDPNTPQTTVKFTDPPGTIENVDFSILPLIRVVGVTPGVEYKFLLSGQWKNSEIDEKNGRGKTFKADSDTIEIKNICDNGEANRTDCADLFKPGTYDITLVLASNKQAIAHTSFNIAQDSNSGGGTTTTTGTGLPYIHTPFGDIHTDPEGLASDIAKIALGIAGGVAFLLMVFGSYRLIFSNGDPEAIQQGRQVITAAVIGLVVIIFAVFLIRLIGINVLGLPV